MMHEKNPSRPAHPVACHCHGQASDLTCRTRWINGVGATNCYATYPHKGHSWSRDGIDYRCRGVRVTTPAKAVEAARNRFYDWRDEWTDQRRMNTTPSARTLGVPVKWRWWLAQKVDKLPGQCWSDLAEYGLGWSLLPWAPSKGKCVKSAQESGCGSCYCGKVGTVSAAAQGAAHGYKPQVIVPDLAPSGNQPHREAT